MVKKKKVKRNPKKKLNTMSAGLIKWFPQIEKDYKGRPGRLLAEYAVRQEERKRPDMFKLTTSVRSNPKKQNLATFFKSKLPVLSKEQTARVMPEGLSPMFDRPIEETGPRIRPKALELGRQQMRRRPENRPARRESPMKVSPMFDMPDVDYDYEPEERSRRYPEHRSHLNEVVKEIVNILQPTGTRKERFSSLVESRRARQERPSRRKKWSIGLEGW